MPLTIVPYRSEHEPAVAAFNTLARTHDAPFELSKTAQATWLPKRDGVSQYREYFLAFDGAEVRGGFTLRRQQFWLNGRELAAANYQGPLSAGIWDRRYMMAGVQMLRAALRDQPLLYALGMGSAAQPLPKLLVSAGWALTPIPFFFKIFRAGNFLRNIAPLRRSKGRALAADLGAMTGLGALGVHSAQALRTKARLPAGATAEAVPQFGAWADTVWQAAREQYLFAAVRNTANQNGLYGDHNAKNIVLRCQCDGVDIGWAVVRSTPMTGDKYFGNMRLGSIIDCLALPGHEATVVLLACRHLRQLGSDLAVSNQSHRLWTEAFARSGFFSAKSNYLFACSPQLAGELGPIEAARPRIHFLRADGDGPIHL